MRIFYISLCLLMIIVSSCAPSPGVVATAMAQTEVSLSFTTPQLPTATITSTSEPPTYTPTEIQKPVPTITNTPDFQVIKSDPKIYLCDTQDFPNEGNYYIPAPKAIFTYRDSNGKEQTFYQEYINHFSNDILTIAQQSNSSHIVQSYMADTGRVDGWSIEYKKGNTSFAGPYTVLCDVESFKTSEGAFLAVQKYNQAETSELVGWEYDEVQHPSLGSADVFLKNEDLKKKDLANHVAIQFSYRNYLVTISAQDKTQKEITFDILYQVGLKILKKLENAPLNAPED
jgi:hypothetical protein